MDRDYATQFNRPPGLAFYLIHCFIHIRVVCLHEAALIRRSSPRRIPRLHRTVQVGPQLGRFTLAVDRFGQQSGRRGVEGLRPRCSGVWILLEEDYTLRQYAKIPVHVGLVEADEEYHHRHQQEE